MKIFFPVSRNFFWHLSRQNSVKTKLNNKWFKLDSIS